MKGATGRSRAASSELCPESSSLECLGVDPVMWNLDGDDDASEGTTGGKGSFFVSNSEIGRDFPPDLRLFLRNQEVLFFSSLPFGLSRAGIGSTGDSGSDGSDLGKGAVDFAVMSRLSTPTISEGTCLSILPRAGEDGFSDEPRPTVA